VTTTDEGGTVAEIVGEIAAVSVELDGIVNEVRNVVCEEIAISQYVVSDAGIALCWI
jgi:hydrogenase maturation factor